MKRFLFLLTFALLLSCQPEETESTTYELLPITEVTVPATFRVNQASNIQVKFSRPTGCHAFNKFYAETGNHNSKVAVESIVFDSGKECPPLNGNGVATNNFKFTPTEVGPYTLEFWNGKNANGEDVFLTYEIDVIN